jgi:hypothetical protein
VRNKAAVRLPYCDNDLVDFSLRVPPGLHNERRLVRYAFITHYPQLAKVPVSGTGLPMVENARMLLKQGDRLLRWHLQKLGIDAHPDRLWRPYKDYNRWFRTVLKEWVHDILLSPRCLERGYYRPEFLKNLVAEHMAGKDMAERIGSLMSIELWHRQFIDHIS